MRVTKTVLCIIMSVAGFSAFAEEQASESKMTIEQAKDQPNKTSGEDVDETLTNAKMRAETGSKSKFSVATAFAYDAGSVEKPLAADRPNIQALTGTTQAADLNGSINGKYNITQKDAILVGGGLRWIAPLEGGKRPASYPQGQMFDVYDPNVLYQRVYKIGDFQSYFQAGPTMVTRSDFVDMGFIGNVSIYNVNAIDLGHSGVTLGLQSYAAMGFFKSAEVDGMTDEEIKDSQADYSFFLYPYVEYQLTEKINLRAVSFLLSYEHTRAHTIDTWRQSKVIQSVGVGISVTRDLFLYPNVQFVPDQLRAADTNVGLAANINIF